MYKHTDSYAVVDAAQGEVHAVGRTSAHLQKGDTRIEIEAGGDELIEALKSGVPAPLANELETLENQAAFSLDSSEVCVLR